MRWPMQTAQMALASGDEQTVIETCELFIDLIEAPAPVLGLVIPDLVRWCMQVTTTTSYELATREMTLQVKPYIICITVGRVTLLLEY